MFKYRRRPVSRFCIIKLLKTSRTTLQNIMLLKQIEIARIITVSKLTINVLLELVEKFRSVVEPITWLHAVLKLMQLQEAHLTQFIPITHSIKRNIVNKPRVGLNILACRKDHSVAFKR